MLEFWDLSLSHTPNSHPIALKFRIVNQVLLSFSSDKDRRTDTVVSQGVETHNKTCSQVMAQRYAEFMNLKGL